MNKKWTFLSGGGLDSAAYIILKHNEIKNVVVIDYGQYPYLFELSMTKFWANEYNLPITILKDDNIKKYNLQQCMLFSGNIEDNAYVNGRNLSFIMDALTVGDNIMLGFTNPGYTPFPDADEQFLCDINDIIKRVFNREIHIDAPYIHTLRTDVFREAYKKDSRFFDYNATCWTPVKVGENFQNCGKCKHCKLLEEQKSLILGV